MNSFYITIPSNTATPQTEISLFEGSKYTETSEIRFHDSGNCESDLCYNTFDSTNHTTSRPTSNNTLNHFRVQLPQRVALQGDWEVGLCEMMYPHTWFNIDHTEYVRIGWKDENDRNGKPRFTWALLTANQYNTADEIAAALTKAHAEGLNEAVRSEVISLERAMALTVAFQYNESNKRFEITVGKPNLLADENNVWMDEDDKSVIKFSPKLQYMLGFSDEVSFSVISFPLLTGKYPVDLKGGFYSLYVYCDLISNQIVGNSLVPLLRTVTIEGGHEDTINAVFTSPHYIPLSKREFDSIEIKINDDQNQPVKFNYGKVLVKLHLRRKKAQFY